jgi:hypothetical protein
MSDAHDMLESTLSLALSIIEERPPTLVPAKVFYYYDSVIETNGQHATLAHTGDAKILNNGNFAAGDKVLVIKTPECAYAYYPFYGAKPIRTPAEFEHLLDVYFMFYVDTSGSMNEEVPTVIELVMELRHRIGATLYTSQGDLDKYFPLPQEIWDERFLEWLARPPEGTEGKPFKAVRIAFINESNDIYYSRYYGLTPGVTYYYLANRGISIGPAALEDATAFVAALAEARATTINMVFNPLITGSEMSTDFSGFLAALRAGDSPLPEITEKSLAIYEQPLNQSVDYYMDILLKALDKFK